jgi:hypothetical protein
MPSQSSLRPFSLLSLALAIFVTACGPRAAATNTPAPASTEGQVSSAPTPTIAQAADTALPTDVTGAPVRGWTVEIVQNGQVSSTETGQVQLARAPFTLRVTLPQPLPVKLNLNADDANFIALQPGFVFTEDCLQALCTGMDVAEERLNPTQVLFVDPQSTHYLYYQSPDDHRWSRATVDANGAVFERDVALLNDTPVEQFGASELYLLLFVDSANPGTIDPDELKKIALLLQ